MPIVGIISSGERFILLDQSDIETQNINIRNIPNIKIVDTAKHSYEETISQPGKRKLQSTITLNVEAEYNNQFFR